jgi:hypothetical protein
VVWAPRNGGSPPGTCPESGPGGTSTDGEEDRGDQIDAWRWPVSTPDETYRAVMPVRTPEHEKATLIITRQGRGRAARVWLTLDGSIRTTAVLDDQQVSELTRRLRGEKDA